MEGGQGPILFNKLVRGQGAKNGIKKGSGGQGAGEQRDSFFSYK